MPPIEKRSGAVVNIVEILKIGLMIYIGFLALFTAWLRPSASSLLQGLFFGVILGLAYSWLFYAGRYKKHLLNEGVSVIQPLPPSFVQYCVPACLYQAVCFMQAVVSKHTLTCECLSVWCLRRLSWKMYLLLSRIWFFQGHLPHTVSQRIIRKAVLLCVDDILTLFAVQHSAWQERYDRASGECS